MKADRAFEAVKVNKVYIVVNPFGGNGRGGRNLNVVKRILEEAKIECVVLATERAGHATEMVRDKPMDGIDAIVVIGGDGTINECVKGLLGRADQRIVPLGLVPGGTGNSVCRSLDEPDIAHAATLIVKGFVRPIDCARVKMDGNTHYCINILTWGLGSDANKTAESLRCCGKMRYDCGALYQICRDATARLALSLTARPLRPTLPLLPS